MKRFKIIALVGIFSLIGFFIAANAFGTGGSTTDSGSSTPSSGGTSSLGSGILSLDPLSLIPVEKIYDTIEHYNRNNNHMFSIDDTILFFEDNGCGQNGGNIVGSIPLDRHRRTFAKEVHQFVNDEARSMLIANPENIKISYPALAGSLIVLYDSPSHSLKTRMKDDFTVFRIHKNLNKLIKKGEGYCVGSFERTDKTPGGIIEKSFVRQKKGSKLDGKVSTVITIPGKKAEAWSRKKWVETLPYDIVFYEDNHCGGGKKGHFRSRITKKAECKNSKSCVNDEIRSMRIYNWAKSGITIKLYDDHKGSHNDDWAVIKLNKTDKRTMKGKKWDFEGASYCIPTFEPPKSKKDKYKKFKEVYKRTFKKGIKLETHYKNGLNGKISRISVHP